MKCHKVVKKLPAYMANELSVQTRSQIDRHLKHCVLCMAELRALNKTDQLLDALDTVEPRRDLVGLVMRHIEREQEARPAFKSILTALRVRWPQIRYATANVLLVVLLAFGLYRYQINRSALNNQAGLQGNTVRRQGQDQTGTPVNKRVERIRLVKPQAAADSMVAGDSDFNFPLSEGDIEQLRRDMRRALSDPAPPDPSKQLLRGALGEIRPVDSLGEPPFLLRFGPNGTLIIEPGSSKATQPAE